MVLKASLPQQSVSASLPDDVIQRLYPAKTVRLILGDQLNAAHSWYQQVDESVLYLVAEMKQETDYCVHHIQKVCAFFAAMEGFAAALSAAGHRVLHLNLDETQGVPDFLTLLTTIADQTTATSVEYQRPDEWRLLQQLNAMPDDARFAHLQIRCVDSEHFLVVWDELPQYFAPNQAQRMEFFYRAMRKRYDILMHSGKPEGGKWNYDQDNRKSFTASELEEIPKPFELGNNVQQIVERLARHGIKTMGRLQPRFSEFSDKKDLFSDTEIHDEQRDLATIFWPVTRSQSRELLHYFCEVCLPKFGKFQDAMTANHHAKWSLYHSRLSFSLNSKMLHPLQVIEAAINAYRARPKEITLPQIEGFVRQILGWREFVRGIYWANMPNYAQMNQLNATRPLPTWFWTGKTNMRCLQQAITQSLDYAYAHHIQRLMVTGNFSLLAGLAPDEVDAWYLGIYIDALEWVEMPNTRGMVLFADGGLLGSKPYAASGNYMNKMSDYCKGCAYSHKEKVGEGACPLNSLYWHFLDRHQGLLRKNPRMGIAYRQWDNVALEEQQARLQQAQLYLDNLEGL